MGTRRAPTEVRLLNVSQEADAGECPQTPHTVSRGPLKLRKTAVRF